MKSIYLVACTKRKQNKQAPAEALYVSDWFKKAKAYTLQHTNTWYILSDKYGLVEPSTLLNPYESTIVKNGTILQKRKWAENVLTDLLKVSKPQDEITFLAGKQYQKYLVPELETLGYTVHIPMENLRFGFQLQWLKQQVE